MTEEITANGETNDSEVIERLAREISEEYDSGVNKLISIKIDINPKQRLANIYAGYIDTSRKSQTGSEDKWSNYLEDLIKWPHFMSLENTEEAWKDLSYPKLKIKRAYLLSKKLGHELEIVNISDDLKCEIKEGKVIIERV